MHIVIQHGRVVDPAQRLDAAMNVYIADGRVAGLGTAPAGFVPDRTIDAQGAIVCPGFVDLSAHLREPGQEYKATIASETRAAAAGGITTLCCPPSTTPVIDTPAVVELIQHRSQQAGFARVVTLGALTEGLRGTQLSNMAALKDAGCVAVSNAHLPVANTLIMRRAMEYASTFGLTVFLHPEDPALRGDGCMHEGPVSTRLGLPGVPEAAETVAVARDLALIEQTGARAHFCRLSSARAAHMVARAQCDGLPITADVAIHQLHLIEVDVGDFNNQCHVQPPLRTLRDRDGLRAAVAKGTISVITSDHQPHEADAKLRPFSETEPGISGVETLLALTLRLVDDGLLDMASALERLSWRPAQILGIDGGRMAVGDVADICVFNPDEYWNVNPQEFLSAGKNTPFTGWDMKGRVHFTLSRGHVVFEQKKIGHET